MTKVGKHKKDENYDDQELHKEQPNRTWKQTNQSKPHPEDHVNHYLNRDQQRLHQSSSEEERSSSAISPDSDTQTKPENATKTKTLQAMAKKIKTLTQKSSSPSRKVEHSAESKDKKTRNLKGLYIKSMYKIAKYLNTHPPINKMDPQNKIKIATLNIARNFYAKYQYIKKLVNLKNISILCLQETNQILPITNQKLLNEIRGKTFINHGSTRASSTAIWINNDLLPHIMEDKIIIKGRCQNNIKDPKHRVPNMERITPQ